jgi:molybdopterin molybdotransferase
VRATLAHDGEGWVATPFAVQDSGMLRTLAQADALIRRPAHDPARPAGAAVDIIRLTNM